MAANRTEEQAGALRERLYLARLLIARLDGDSDSSRAEQLATRNAVLLHLYTALTGLVRKVGRDYGAMETGAIPLGLSEALEAFSRELMRVPEAQLLRAALEDPADPVHWLEQQMRRLSEPEPLSRRPRPTEDELRVILEDPAEVLGEQDMAALRSCVERVDELADQVFTHAAEW